MRTFTTFILALSFGCLVSACDAESHDEPAAESVRAKQKIPCGGFAGLECPDDLTCVDDPSDACDPAQGGADCIGMCIKPKKGKKHDTCDYNDPAPMSARASRSAR